MDSFNTILLTSSAVLIVALVAVRLADRTGLPSLLIYLGVGLLVGGDRRRCLLVYRNIGQPCHQLW